MVARLGNREQLVFLLIFLCVPALARGQTTPTPQSRMEPGTLARWAPSSTRVFLTINKFSELEQAVRHAKALPFFKLVSSQGGEESGKELGRSLHKLIGAGTNISLEDLSRCEIGLAAQSWSELMNPIWLLRPADEALLKRWFPQHATQGSNPDSARVFRNDDGRFVCIGSNIVALAPRAADWTQLGAVLRIMAGTEADVLESTPAYRDLIRYLPGRPMAQLYYTDATAGAESGRPPRSLGVGAYQRQGRIELAFRGSGSEAQRQQSISDTAMERFLKLPQTTLGGYITTVDWSGFSNPGEGASPGLLRRYAWLLTDLGKSPDPEAEPVPRLGNHFIVAWGQDFSRRGLTPQCAVLLESPDAPELAQFGGRVVESLIRIASTLEMRDVSPELPVVASTHLGVPVSSVPLKTFAKSSRFAWIKALSEWEPSWAASGQWFIATLGKEHLHQILDAQIGFVGNLRDHRDARAIKEGSRQNRGAVFLQGTLAAKTVRQWEAHLRKTDFSELAGKVWPGKTSGSDELGIELGDVELMGMVEVKNVLPSTPADGRLHARDLIVGVDGRLLEIASANADLRSWWEASEPGSNHTLRVLRDGEMMELEIVRDFDEVTFADLWSEPLDLLRELAAVLEGIPSATLQVHNTGGPHFSALLSLQVGAKD